MDDNNIKIKCVYAMIHNDVKIYIGSTMNFKKRKLSHKTKCYNKNGLTFHNLPQYVYIRNNCVWKDIQFKILQEFYEVSKEVLEEWEELYYKIHKDTCYNSKHPQRTKKEYQQDNKEIIKEKGKQWREKNKEIIKQTGKEYYNKVKDTKKHKDYRIKYHENNIELIKKYNKKYHQDNREKMLAQNKEIIVCNICNQKIKRCNKARHQRADICKFYLK